MHTKELYNTMRCKGYACKGIRWSQGWIHIFFFTFPRICIAIAVFGVFNKHYFDRMYKCTEEQLTMISNKRLNMRERAYTMLHA